MYLQTDNHTYKYECEKICRLYFPAEKITVNDAPVSDDSEDFVYTTIINCGEYLRFVCRAFINSRMHEDEMSVGAEECSTDYLREMYLAKVMVRVLGEITGISLPWGTLTGIRPAKLMRKHINELGEDEAVRLFREFYGVSEEKTFLARSVALYENSCAEMTGRRSFSLYISIPFCPSRCSYCSFVSHSVENAGQLIPEYVDKLCLEIEETARLTSAAGLVLETVYIGGGTPTSFCAEHLKKITDTLRSNFPMDTVKEFTVEAGRPDTVDADKLAVLKNAGVTRISINPQTFSDSVLEAVGRRHTSALTIEKFRLAREMGFDNINMDLIAGLPTDSFEGFKNSLDTAISLAPENITVHTLAMKRASFISTENREICPEDETVRMVEYANRVLPENGYLPYYMYRQSKSVGNLENVGWCKKDRPCLYNVYMMEEIHTVLALGAAAVTKLTLPGSEYLERICNFKYPYEYISRFDELLRRKDALTAFYADV